MKNVTRRYYSKKLGSYVTKTYSYNKQYKYKHKSTRGRVITDKMGRVHQKNLDAYLESVRKEARTRGLNDREILSLEHRIKALVKQKHDSRTRITTNGLTSKLIRKGKDDSKIKKFLANAGYSPEDMAYELKVDEEEILNPNNWNNDMFTFNGRIWQFNFTYTGNFFVELDTPGDNIF